MATEEGFKPPSTSTPVANPTTTANNKVEPNTNSNPSSGQGHGHGQNGRSRFERLQSNRIYRFGQTSWAWRRAILFGLGATYTLTYLYWKIYDGGIVEAKSYGSNLNYLLNSSSTTGSPEEPPRVMTLFEVIRAIKFIEQDDRIRGIVADFSNISVPSVPSYNLGLAQLEEIQESLLELRRTKIAKFGSASVANLDNPVPSNKDDNDQVVAAEPKEDGWRTIAWTDSFNSQAQYLFATCFDEVYTQPTGEIPLVGLGSTIPFYGRLAKWLGIQVHAEARNEYKSFVQPYIDEQLTQPQKANQLELINDLNDNLMTYIARNRFPTRIGLSGLNHVKQLSQTGPYTASEAVKNGLLNGTAYRQDILDSIMDPEKGGDEDKQIKGFYHYAKVMERQVEKMVKDVMDIGVVYLMGTIGDPGEFGTAAVVRGLKEAGEDDEIGAVVLRIDSGGGGVVESDTIWAAVRDLREKYGKTVVASFGNASASGGYLVSTHADAIMAAPSTITGSIGVASLRPTFLRSFFDRIHITLDSLFTGSRFTDLTHQLTESELNRYRAHVDEMYADFKNRVVQGRGVHPELIDLIAGGRVYAGLKAFELNAPKELINQIRGWDREEEAKKVKLSSGKQTLMGSPSEESTKTTETSSSSSNKAAIVVLPEDQETSPFAVPSSPQNEANPLPSSSSPTDVTPVPDAAELNAQKALATASTSEVVSTSTIAEQHQHPTNAGTSCAAGIYEIPPGPFGRGLIDGLGGIRDSAIYACELFISNGIQGYKLDHPEVSDQQALKMLLPDAEAQIDPITGEMLMSMDVRLKRFPVQKGFWQTFKEASERGDSMEVKTLIKGVVVGALFKIVADGLSDELDELGILSRANGVGTSGLGLGKKSSWRKVRAEWGGLNLR